MKALYKKELAYFLKTPVGYIIIILFAGFANFLFTKDIFVIGSASMKPFFGIVPWLLMVFIPALGMRSFAEEKRTNTLEVLLALPLTESQIVLAKWGAIVTLAGIAISLTFGLPIALLAISHVYIPEIIIGYLGVLSLAGSFAAVSVWFSSFTKNQVLALLASVLMLFFLIVLATDLVSPFIPAVIRSYTLLFSPLFHLQQFAKGVVELRSVVYFFSFSGIFLFLTVINLEKRN